MERGRTRRAVIDEAGIDLVGLEQALDAVELQPDEREVRIAGEAVRFGTDLLFQAENRPGFVFGVEICEDYWAPLPPSTRQAMAGARILLNLSASNIVIGKSDDRALLCASQSARAMAAWSTPECSKNRLSSAAKKACTT